MTKARKELLTKIYKKEVHNKVRYIDPDYTVDWFSLTLGWALAKGEKPKDARDFARYIKYDTNLG